jgi:hypothetical protein
MLLDLIRPETPSLTELGSTALPRASDDTLHWFWGDSSANGQLVYTASVDVAGDAIPDQDGVAFYRAACLFLVSKLDDAKISEAYESLRDLYQWQLDQANIVARQIVSGVLPVQRIARVERPSFIIDEDL